MKPVRPLLLVLLIVPGLLTGCVTKPDPASFEPEILWKVTGYTPPQQENEIPLPATANAPVVAPDGTAYICLWGPHGVIGINRNGDIIRNLASTEVVFHPPSVDAQGRIYFGADSGTVYAYDSDGAKLWEFQGGGNVRSSPSIAADGTIIIGCHDGHLYAINDDGTFKWAYDIVGSPFADPVIGVDGTIYIGSFRGEIHAVNPDGTRQWMLDVGGMPLGFAIDNQNNLFLFNLGKLIRVPPDGSSVVVYADSTESPPVIGPDGTHYYRSGNTIHAVGKWDCVTPTSAIAMPLVAADGTIYSGFEAVSSDGELLYSLGLVSRAASALDEGLLFVVSTEPAFYAIKVPSWNLADGIWPKYKKDIYNTGR
ncbi:PQQ-binding-like beta-propeller repeat protein, partial [Gemmatimonadota bacterium]